MKRAVLRIPGVAFLIGVVAGCSDSPVQLLAALGMGSGEPSPLGALNVATGTYTYDSSAHRLILEIRTSTFVCAGPGVGTDTLTVVSLTDTTLTLQDPGGSTTTAARTAGTAGGIAGTWRFEELSGDSWELVLEPEGTFTLIGHIVTSCVADAWSVHWVAGYYVESVFHDPQHLATSVTLSGPGIAGSMDLGFDAERGGWTSWTPPASNVSLGLTPPPVPLTYVFTVTDDAGRRTETATVSCYVEEFATGLSPIGDVFTTPVFSWTPIGQPGFEYQIQLSDSQMRRIWDSATLLDAGSVVYTGPPLTPGMAYHYGVSASSPEESCSSIAEASFTYVGASPSAGMNAQSLRGEPEEPDPDARRSRSGSTGGP